MELHFASRMKDYEEGIFQVLNEKKNEKYLLKQVFVP